LILAIVFLGAIPMTPGKILILEDHPDVARFYEAALSADGNAVTVGEYNGLQLALLFRRRSPNGRVVSSRFSTARFRPTAHSSWSPAMTTWSSATRRRKSAPAFS